MDWTDQQRRLADKPPALLNQEDKVNDDPSTLKEKVHYFIFHTTFYTFPDSSLAPENYLEFVEFWEDFSNSLRLCSTFHQQEKRRQGIINL